MQEPTRDQLPWRIRKQIAAATTAECWEWTGRRNPEGYGIVVLGREQLAHRVVRTLLIGPVAAGQPLDHPCCSPSWCSGGPTCPHRRCVNPAHLQPSTHRDNVLRGNGLTAQNARKTECPQGHPYDAANTYVERGGARRCRACMRAREQARPPRSKARRAAR